MKKQMRNLKQIGKQMSRAPDGQVSLTDPDARSIATSGRGTGMVATTYKRQWIRSIT